MSRLVEDLATPLGFSWLMLVVATVWLWLRRRRREAWVPGGIALLLFLFGGTQLSAWLLGSLERPYAGIRAADLPDADVVVMLGGLLSSSRYDPYGLEFNSAVDRAITAVDLVQRGKAPVLVVGGGVVQGFAEGTLESDLWLRWLEAWHLTPEQVHQLGICRNTHDEGVAFKRLAEMHGWKRIILVTSAAHMRRAEGVFRQLGIPVTCFATDFRGLSALETGGLRLGVPTPSRLDHCDSYLHEIVGRLVYRWRGWCP